MTAPGRWPPLRPRHRQGRRRPAHLVHRRRRRLAPGPLADQQGSIVAIADRYGNPVAINAYDEWGIPNAARSSGRFGYTGQAWIPELGMYYYKARFYSPTLGRFLQTDP
jgi:hypothetical protein